MFLNRTFSLNNLHLHSEVFSIYFNGSRFFRDFTCTVRNYSHLLLNSKTKQLCRSFHLKPKFLLHTLSMVRTLSHNCLFTSNSHPWYRHPSGNYLIVSAGNVIVEKVYIEEGTSKMLFFFECFLYIEMLCTDSYAVFYETVRFDHHMRKRASQIEGNQCTRRLFLKKVYTMKL